MKELIGHDLFEQISISDAIAITTNCSVMTDADGNNPENPMGAMAGVAASRWPNIPSIYGHLLMTVPNVPVILGYINKMDPSIFVSFDEMEVGVDYTALVAFPTMLEIGEPADLDLIARSAQLLREMADIFSWEAVMTGRPGAGVGGLDWKEEVKPLLEEIWDERFICCHFEPKHSRGFIKFGDEEKDDGQEDQL